MIITKIFCVSVNSVVLVCRYVYTWYIYVSHPVSPGSKLKVKRTKKKKRSSDAARRGRTLKRWVERVAFTILKQPITSNCLRSKEKNFKLSTICIPKRPRHPLVNFFPAPATRNSIVQRGSTNFSFPRP